MQNQNYKITILGCGNMAQAMIIPMLINLRKKISKDSNIEVLTFTPSKTKAINLSNKIKKLNLNITSAAYNQSKSIISHIKSENLSNTFEIYFLCFKPYQLEDFSSKTFSSLDIFKDKIICSILAGISTETLQAIFSSQNIIRMMPNTPITIGEGVNFISFAQNFNSKYKNICNILIKSISKNYTIQESMMDVVTPVIGSGPAYVFKFAEILINFLIDNKIDKKIAENSVRDMLSGASKMLQQKYFEEKLSAADLRKQVTSKAGVTETVLLELKQQQLKTIITNSLNQGIEKSKLIGKSD